MYCSVIVCASQKVRSSICRSSSQIFCQNIPVQQQRRNTVVLHNRGMTLSGRAEVFFLFCLGFLRKSCYFSRFLSENTAAKGFEKISPPSGCEDGNRR